MLDRPILATLIAGLAACGAHDGSNAYVDTRPQVVVTPTLSELPDSKRDQVIDSARARPDPEQRKRDLKPKERKFELGAAIGAAILGEAFSHSPNATVGTESVFDETGSLQKMKKTRPPEKGDAPILEPLPGQEPDADANQLVPWVNVKAPVPAAPDDSH